MTLVSCCCGLMPALDPGGWCWLPIGPPPPPPSVTLSHWSGPGSGASIGWAAQVTGASWSYTFAPLIRDLKEVAGTRSRNLIISNQDLQVNLLRSVLCGPLKIADEATTCRIQLYIKYTWVLLFPLSFIMLLLLSKWHWHNFFHSSKNFYRQGHA